MGGFFIDDNSELDELIEQNGLVAHYTKKCTAIEHILPTQKIKFSSLQGTNDPYEFKADWLGDLESLVAGDDHEKNKEQCFEANQKYSEIVKVVKQKIKIFCATRNDREPFLNYSKPRMWAQYGENHGGVCLLFSEEKLNSQIKKYQTAYYGEVETFAMNYDEFYQRPEVINAISVSISPEHLDLYLENNEHLFEHIRKQNVLDYLKRKHPDWKAENENRWLVFSKSADDFLLDYGDALEAVVLGCEFPLQPQTEFLKICTQLKGSKTKLFKLTHERGKFCVKDVARERYED